MSQNLDLGARIEALRKRDDEKHFAQMSLDWTDKQRSEVRQALLRLQECEARMQEAFAAKQREMEERMQTMLQECHCYLKVKNANLPDRSNKEWEEVVVGLMGAIYMGHHDMPMPDQEKDFRSAAAAYSWATQLIRRVRESAEESALRSQGVVAVDRSKSRKIMEDIVAHM
jgi:hypothetical protein